MSSRFPIALYWGPAYVMLYEHPAAMGRPTFEVLPEIRGLIEPLLDQVLATGEAIWSEDLMRPLLRNGYAVFAAPDGEAALDELAGIDHLCMVLLVLFMPRMNGWDFLERMRARAEHAAVPVIVHSSAPCPAPAGVARVLRKPLELERLRSVVREDGAAP